MPQELGKQTQVGITTAKGGQEESNIEKIITTTEEKVSQA